MENLESDSQEGLIHHIIIWRHEKSYLMSTNQNTYFNEKYVISNILVHTYDMKWVFSVEETIYIFSNEMYTIFRKMSANQVFEVCDFSHVCCSLLLFILYNYKLKTVWEPSTEELFFTPTQTGCLTETPITFFLVYHWMSVLII